MMQVTTEGRRPMWRKHLAGLLVGAFMGGAGAATVIAAKESGLIGEMGTSQLIAALVALVYLLMGVAVGVGVAAPGVGARFLNVEDADELDEQRASLIPSALGCGLLATALFVLALSGPGALLPPAAGLAIFVGAVAVGVWFSLRSAYAADELMRAMMRDSAAASYYTLFLILGGWAVLAHLSYVPAPTMLDVVTLLYGLTLLVTFWVIGRRGMIR